MGFIFGRPDRDEAADEADRRKVATDACYYGLHHLCHDTRCACDCHDEPKGENE